MCVNVCAYACVHVIYVRVCACVREGKKEARKRERLCVCTRGCLCEYADTVKPSRTVASVDINQKTIFKALGPERSLWFLKSLW